jgi:hypothetical protein
MFVVVASGTAALSPLQTSFPIILPVITTFAGLSDLVFDVSGSARLHGALRKQFFTLFAEIGPESNIEEANKHMEAIYADEPPIIHGVNALAYNTAMTAFGRSKRNFIVIGWWRRLTRHILPASSDAFSTVAETRAAR